MKNCILSLAFLFLLITETNAQLIVNAGGDLSVCYGNSVGLAATAAGGTPPYTFQWTPSADLNNANIANPTLVVYSSNNYIVQVTDNLGAQSSDTINLIMLPNPSIYFYATDSIACVDQPINFISTVNSGTAPFTYVWNFGGGSGTVVNDPTPTHVYGAPGNYQPILNVTDANGCYSSLISYVYVRQPIISAQASPALCNGSSDGFAQAVTTGGFPPYFYNWSNGATTQTINNLSAGTYTVTVFDSHQCSATAANTLTEPTPITLATTATNESASGACDGLLVLTGSGGVPPYTLNWSNGYTMPTINGLCAGTYTVTITDANGCTAASAGVVGSGSCTNNTLVVSITSQDLSCTHQTDTMTANVTGGTPPYTYAWNTGVSAQSQVVNQAGVYAVYISDSLGCVKTAVDTLLNTGLNISVVYTTPANCNGNPTGAAKIAVTGGTPPYTYLWTNGSTADSIENVPAGNYGVIVTDAVSCVVNYSVTVLQNNTNWSYYVYISSTNTNCANNGTATANVYGGSSPFTYLWSNNDTTATISNLATGNYTLTVTGADGCVRLGSVAITTSCYNVITGSIYNDANSNCVKDSAEAGSNSYYYVTATGSNGTYYGYAYYNTGYYQINIPVSGTFLVTISPNSWGNSCANINLCGPQTVNFTGVGDTTVLNLGVTTATGFDLSLHPGWTSANPGFTKQYWVLVYQQNQPAYSGPATIIFKYDSILQYQSSNNSGVHNATNRTVTWQVADASVNVPWANRPQAFLTVPANTPIGYQLTQEFWVLPYGGDCDTSDNHQVYTQPVTGSMDPNEKEVTPAGDIQEEDSVLTYTIHFQNTGNDTTSFIIIKDTLSSHLNPATVQNMASSHEYTSFDVSGSGLLTWLFNPIFLVDSATNEPASKGFVTFRVKKKAGLPLNTEIKNSASIYFDYNEPIVTNTVTSKLTNPNSVFNLSTDAAINVNVIPNPFTQSATVNVEGVTGAYNFELFDVSGKRMKSINGISDSRFTINRETMSTGVYFYSVTTNTKQKAFGRVMVQ